MNWLTDYTVQKRLNQSYSFTFLLYKKSLDYYKFLPYFKVIAKNFQKSAFLETAILEINCKSYLFTLRCCLLREIDSLKRSFRLNCRFKSQCSEMLQKLCLCSEMFQSICLCSEMLHFCNISEQSSQMLHDFGRFFCNISERGVSPGSLTSFRD